MAICPFMSKGAKPDDWAGCIISCSLRVGNECALRILAEKAIYDAKQLETANGNGNCNNSASKSN